MALTADAELRVEDTDKLPWANIKLSTFANGGKPTLGDPRYAKWDALGIPMGEYMNTQEQAKYKYQIDNLGGCGGTRRRTSENCLVIGSATLNTLNDGG